MPLTPRIEPRPATRTHTPTAQILVNPQHMLTLPAQDSLLVALRKRPDVRCVLLEGVVTTNASVEFAAAGVADGDDVQGRVPVCALGLGR